MFRIPLLSIIILLPLFSSCFVMASKEDELQNTKLSTLYGSFIVLLTSIAIFTLFDFSKNTVQLMEQYTWISNFKIKYIVGIDRYSLFFILMIAIISFLSIVWTLKTNIHKTKCFFVSVLLFESFSIGAFVSYDMFLLLFFMEASIFPLFIMLNTFQKDETKNAVLQLFVYGMASAICIMIAMLMIYNEKETSNIIELYQAGYVKNTICFWFLLLGIAIKLPIFPFHYWLPKVHVESPTVCSVFLASVMLKFSSLIIVKILYHMFFNNFSAYSELISSICVLSALIACANLFFQIDLKRFFAYFSILHMNVYFLILLSGCGIKQFVFSVIYHSFIVAVLFLITNIIKTICKTRDIIELKNIKTDFIKAKRLILLGILCLIGLPLTWGFIVEIISLYASSMISPHVACIVGAILIVSSTRAFYIYQSVFGTWNVNSANSIDMLHISNFSKNTVLYVFFTIIFGIGIFANIFL